MANHIEITFPVPDTELQQILIARLAEEGYDGFEETGNDLKAFIPEAGFDPAIVQEIAAEFAVPFSMKLVAGQNWNAAWESSFQPVVVDDFVALRAGFHEPVGGVEHEIIITPKMSFGTGHHATTWLMIRQMRALDFRGKKVFDFGTGTGVLAILAEKMGAADVLAIDYDDWSIENAGENQVTNHCSKIRLVQADTAAKAGKPDIILANINKNVILDNLQLLQSQLNPGGTMLLSGLLVADEADIREAAAGLSLQLVDKQEKNGWICLQFAC
ncbi:MAG: 50S ribosomal protein L11 methyltransferase [Sphingobacteriales bacterium]|nr:50S ribosomal protein L11 methyltransferase [Sphingobacteriales bacterium]